jgi:hypothetical protein
MVKVVEMGAARVDAELVESLEELLAHAKAGQINCLFAVAMTLRGRSLAVRSNCSNHEMVGAVTVHRQMMIDALIENLEPSLEIG